MDRLGSGQRRLGNGERHFGGQGRGLHRFDRPQLDAFGAIDIGRFDQDQLRERLVVGADAILFAAQHEGDDENREVKRARGNCR